MDVSCYYELIKLYSRSVKHIKDNVMDTIYQLMLSESLIHSYIYYKHTQHSAPHTTSNHLKKKMKTKKKKISKKFFFLFEI